MFVVSSCVYCERKDIGVREGLRRQAVEGLSAVNHDLNQNRHSTSKHTPKQNNNSSPSVSSGWLSRIPCRAEEL